MRLLLAPRPVIVVALCTATTLQAQSKFSKKSVFLGKYVWALADGEWRAASPGLKSAGRAPDCLCQPFFCLSKFWHVWNPLPQSIRLRVSVLVRYWAGQGE